MRVIRANRFARIALRIARATKASMRRAASFLTVAGLCAVHDIYGVRPDIEDVDTQRTTTTTTTTNIDSKIAWFVDFASKDTVIKAIVDHIFGGELRQIDTNQSAHDFAHKEAADKGDFNSETVGLVLESQLWTPSRSTRVPRYRDPPTPPPPPTMADIEGILKNESPSVPYLVEEAGTWHWHAGDIWRKKQRWRYMRNASSDKLEPYGLGHQMKESVDFCRLCQSFAQLYMFNDLWPDKEFGRPATTPRKLWSQLAKGKFGNNTKVIVKYWEAVLTQSGWKLAKETQEEEAEENAEQDEKKAEQDEKEAEQDEKEARRKKELSQGMLEGLWASQWALGDGNSNDLVNDSDALSGPVVHDTARPSLRVGFWQNGFFADFYFWAAGFFRIFSPDFLSSFLWEKSPEKSSRKIPGKILQKLYNKNPRHISAEGPGQHLSDTPYCALWGFWCLNMANSVRYPLPLF